MTLLVGDCLTSMIHFFPESKEHATVGVMVTILCPRLTVSDKIRY